MALDPLSRTDLARLPALVDAAKGLEAGFKFAEGSNTLLDDFAGVAVLDGVLLAIFSKSDFVADGVVAVPRLL